MKFFTRLPRWLAGALLLFTTAATPVPAKAFAPLVILGIALGSATAVGAGAMVYEHEREPLVFTPLPEQGGPMPLPPPDRSITAGPRPAHTYTPLKVAKAKPHKAAPAAPVVETHPEVIVPAEPKIITNEPNLVPAPEELHPVEQPRVVLPAPVEPKQPTTEPESPVKVTLGGIVSDILWDLFYAVIMLGALGLIVRAGKQVYATYKASKIVATVINQGTTK